MSTAVLSEEQKATSPEQAKEKLLPEEHYFKIDKRILDIQSTKDISKSELLVYLQHCRAINPKQNLGCSFVGKKNTAKINLGLDPKIIDKAEKTLIEKHFLRYRPDVKTGILKTTAVEVLAFPEYRPPEDNKSTGTFNPNPNNEHQHRKYKNSSFINIPSAYIDQGLLKGLRRQSIFALIWLYDNINWLDYWGVDHHLIYKKASDSLGFSKYSSFGEGFHQSIYEKICVEAAEPTNWYLY